MTDIAPSACLNEDWGTYCKLILQVLLGTRTGGLAALCLNKDWGTMLQAGIHKCFFERGLGDLFDQGLGDLPVESLNKEWGTCLNEDWGTCNPMFDQGLGDLASS